MKSLYETILNSTRSGRTNYFEQNISKITSTIFSSNDYGAFVQFLKNNNLLLDKDHTHRIMSKLIKCNFVPDNIEFRKKHGIEEQLKAGPEDFFVTAHGGYAAYDINVDYVMVLQKSKSNTTICERIISMNKDCIYVVDTPETEHLIKELDKHFEKNTIVEQINYSKNSFFSSRIGAKYVQYMFTDMKKEFVI
jgi:hypothetical protein